MFYTAKVRVQVNEGKRTKWNTETVQGENDLQRSKYHGKERQNRPYLRPCR